MVGALESIRVRLGWSVIYTLRRDRWPSLTASERTDGQLATKSINQSIRSICNQHARTHAAAGSLTGDESCSNRSMARQAWASRYVLVDLPCRQYTRRQVQRATHDTYVMYTTLKPSFHRAPLKHGSHSNPFPHPSWAEPTSSANAALQTRVSLSCSKCMQYMHSRDFSIMRTS